MPTTAVRRSASNAALHGLTRFLKHLEKADVTLSEEAPHYKGLLPKPEQLLEAAKRLGRENFDGEKVAMTQQVGRNMVRALGNQSGGHNGADAAVDLYNLVVQDTESVVARSAYMVGVARGMRWAVEMSPEPASVARQAGQRAGGGAR